MPSLFTSVRIIDCTKVFSGPFATRLFADYGAEVLKIENTDRPDDARLYPPLQDDWSGYFEIVNRNKKGIALNLKDPESRSSLYQLCRQADVFVENLAVSTKHSLKIDYETIRQLNPSIIYVSLSGVGQEEDKKYYDVVAQAESGLLSLCGTKETPMKIGPSVVDAFSGMTAAFAIASALFYREKTGIGQYIDVSMLGAAMNLLENNLIEYSLSKNVPQRTGNQDNVIAPFGVYKTQDRYIVVAAGNDTLWNTLCVYLKEHGASFDEAAFHTNTDRLAHTDELTRVIEQVFAARQASEICKELSEKRIPCSVVQSMEDVYNDQKNFDRGFLMKFQHPQRGDIVIPGSGIRFSAVSPVSPKPAPSCGQDNKAYGI